IDPESPRPTSSTFALPGAICYTPQDFGRIARATFVSVTIVAFYLIAAITAGSALGVALGNNIVYSAFALMGTLLGVAATFVLLGADFLGVVQLLVYVGGILVLTLFAVMLTHRIADVHVSNRAVGRLPGLLVVGVVFVWMVRTALRAGWVVKN